MATKLKEANFNGSGGSHFKIRLSYDLTQSQANNTSTIKYYLYVISMDGYSGSGSTCKGYINGSQVGTFTSIGVNTTKEIGTKTVTVTHNNDGTKSVSYSASVDTPWTLGDASLSGTLTLPTILREANIVSAPDFTDEENPTITYTNPLGNDVQSLQACISLTGGTDDIVYRDIPKTGTSYTFSLTTAERNVLRQATTSSTTRTVKFFVKTRISNTNYYSSLQRTLTIVNANPTQTVSFLETNQKIVTLLGSSAASTIVQNTSNLKITVSPTALKSATISKVEVTHNGVTKTDTSSPYEFTNIVPVTNKFVAKTTDSRTLSASTTITKTLIAYEPVQILSMMFKRQNQTSSNIKLTASIKWWNSSFNGTANTVTIKWKKGTNGTLTTLSNNEYSIDNTTHTITVDTTLSNILPYDTEERFYLEVHDLLSDSYNNMMVSVGKPIFSLGRVDAMVEAGQYEGPIMRVTNGVKEVGLHVGSGGENRGVWDTTENRWIIATDDNNAYITAGEAGQVQTATNNQALLIKKASSSSDSTPSDGVVLEYGSGTTNKGQLFLGDNASQGVYYNGWTNGTRGSWKKLATTSDVWSANNVLWSGGYFMTETHVANLSDTVSNQKSGIVLVWSGYDNGVKNYHWNITFVPKQFIQLAEGAGVCTFCIGTGNNTYEARKYVYVYNNRIEGNQYNTRGDGSEFVLRYVIGV